MSVLKRLASDTAYYGLSTILGRMVYYLLVILHTAVFLPAEQAIVVDFFSIVAVLNIVYTYGMETAFFRFSNKAENPQHYYNLAQSSLIISTLLFSCFICLNAASIAEWRGFPESKVSGSTEYVVWVALILATDALTALPFARLRQQRKAKQFALIRLTNILFNVGLNVFFLYFCKNISEGVFLPHLKESISLIYNPEKAIGYIFLSNLIANLLMVALLWRQFLSFRFTLRWDILKQMWFYGYPILIMGLAGAFNGVADRFLLKAFLPEDFYTNRSTDDVLGIYGNCVKLAIFMNLAVQAFRYAADPFFFSKAEDKNTPAILALSTKWFIIVCVLIWLFVSLFLDVFANVFLKKAIYHEALPAVPILLLANLFIGIYYNLGFWFKLNDKTHYGTYLTFFGLAITLLMNYFLIPIGGYLGCSVAFMLSTAAMCVVSYYLGERHYPVPYNVKSALFYIFSAGLLIFGSSQIHISNLKWSLPYHAALFLSYLGIVLVLERKTLMKNIL